MMLKMVTFTIGTELDTNGNEISEEKRLESITNTMSFVSDLFGGCTIIDSLGSWKTFAGTLATEKGITVKAAIDMECRSKADIRACAQNLNIFWNQASIMVEFDNEVWFEEFWLD